MSNLGIRCFSGNEEFQKMGVIHKLREDVVSFIVDRKKSNPSISVRQLADLTSEKFQIKVSKSSVNSVLIKFSLSSSVGRRTASLGRAEKFSIPAMKKKEISEKIKASGFIPEAAVLQKPLGEILPGPDADASKETPAEGEFPEGRAQTDRPAARLRDEARRQKERERTPLSGGMGFVFLKAAQWEISQKPFLAEMIAKNLPFPVSRRFGPVCDMFLFLKFLGVEAFDHVHAYRGHGLWALNGFCDSPANEKSDLMEFQRLLQWGKSVEPSKVQEMALKYKREKEQALLEVKGFKLTLEDQSELAMDAAMISFAGGAKIFPLAGSLLPIEKAMKKLSNNLISNIQSACFHKAPGETKFDRAFYDMAAIFENVPGKKIIKAGVIDQNDQKIAEFSTIPSQKRHFLIGIDPEQKEFGELTKNAKWGAKKAFYHRGADKIVYFTETKTDFIARQIRNSASQVRVLTVWQNEEKELCWGVLTNNKKGRAEDILREYMEEWPYFGEKLQEEPAAASLGGLAEEGSATSLSGICLDFIGELHRYCQKYFFPPAYSKIDANALIEIIYGISGAIHASEKVLAVSLDTNPARADYGSIKDAVRKVNERRIFDYSGRRLWLEL